MAKKKARTVKKARAPIAAPIVEAQPAPAQEAPVQETPAAEPVVAAAPASTKHFVGAWAYVIGIIIALAASIWRPEGLNYTTIAILAMFGFVVGVLNITDDEVITFLVATVAFIVSASSVRLALENLVFVQTFMMAIIIFTAASAFVVSVKAIFHVAKNV